MRNTIMIFTLALLVCGCGQNAARVAKVEAEKKKLESVIAALKASEAKQSANGKTKAQSTTEAVGVEFKGKIAKKYEDSVEWWAKPAFPR